MESKNLFKITYKYEQFNREHDENVIIVADSSKEAMQKIEDMIKENNKNLEQTSYEIEAKRCTFIDFVQIDTLPQEVFV